MVEVYQETCPDICLTTLLYLHCYGHWPKYCSIVAVRHLQVFAGQTPQMPHVVVD
jgi:hypothetical protein